MRRTLLAPLLLWLLVAAAPTHVGAQATPPPVPPPLKASLAACESGVTAAERFAVFTGSMPALAGTERMWMRFDLMTRATGAKRWRRVKAPAFSRWDRSAPSRAGFVYTKRVERLEQEASYRAVVRFRWLARRGRVQRERVLRTKACLQPSQRPNLRVVSFAIAPGPDAGHARYVVTLVNAGPVAAGAFAVAISGLSEVLVQPVPGLAPAERTTLEIRGPACQSGAHVTATLDAQGDVRESDEDDNRSVRGC
jgi:hypothetical protein